MVGTDCGFDVYIPVFRLQKPRYLYISCALQSVSAALDTSCVAQQAAHNTLYKVFGFSEFRSGQLEAILKNALHGRDTFVRMATGSGKSLCMFMVPLLQSNTAMGIVISPLNSLMDEQVKLRLYAANYVNPQSLFSYL